MKTQQYQNIVISPERILKAKDHVPLSPAGPDYQNNTWVILSEGPDAKATVTLPDSYEKETPKPVNSGSWAQKRRSGEIHMTPYNRLREKVEYFPVLIPNRELFLNLPYASGWYKDLPKLKTWVGKPALYYNSWDQVLTDDEIRSLPSKGTHDEIHNIEYDLSQKVMSEAVSDNLSSYDALTELAELRSTLESIQALVKLATRPLQSFALAAKNIRNRKAYESLWMRYRYEIGPMISSIKDIIETYKDKEKTFKLSRASESFSYSQPKFPVITDGVFTFEAVTGSITARATVKASYESIAQRLFDQIQLNPFVTAWELVPFSFVIDWFVNVGDWLQSQTATLASYASQRVACLSIKKDVTSTTFVISKHRWSVTKSSPFHSQVTRSLPPMERQQVYRRHVLESYNRSLFTPQDVDLGFGLEMTWKRWLDAFVLGQIPLNKALRSLK